MKITLPDLDGLIGSLSADYPELSVENKKLLALDLNALQQRYFETISEETVLLEAVLDSGLTLHFASEPLCSGSLPEKKDILAVYLNDREIPLLGYADAKRRSVDCCALLEGDLVFFARTPHTTARVQVLLRRFPPKIEYGNGRFVGSLYIAEKHLPLVTAALRACIAHAVFEGEEGDFFAECFENLSRTIARENEEVRRGRAAL